MASSKIVITVTEDLLSEVDTAARERGESRSGFISGILRRALRARTDSEITCKLNDLFADEVVAAEQSRVAREMDSAGTDWSEEGWDSRGRYR